MLALGVDVSVSHGLDFVLLDERRRLVGAPLRARTLDDLARFLAAQKPNVVAIDSPLMSTELGVALVTLLRVCRAVRARLARE